MISQDFELSGFFLFQYELLFCIQDLEDSVSYAYVKVNLSLLSFSALTLLHVIYSTFQLTSIAAFIHVRFVKSSSKASQNM